MKITQLSFLLLSSLLLFTCKKESVPLEVKGFMVKSIIIKNIPLEKEGNCWDELDCATPDGSPDIYLKIEHDSPTIDNLTFFTSEIFQNHNNEQEIIITIPDKVFNLNFFYQFNLYDKDGLDLEADDRIPLSRLFFPQGYIIDNEVLPTTIGLDDDRLVIALEYVYE